jgi:hypothetical protein
MGEVTVLLSLQKTKQQVTLQRWSTKNNRLHFASEPLHEQSPAFDASQED